ARERVVSLERVHVVLQDTLSAQAARALSRRVSQSDAGGHRRPRRGARLCRRGALREWAREACEGLPTGAGSRRKTRSATPSGMETHLLDSHEQICNTFPLRIECNYTLLRHRRGSHRALATMDQPTGGVTQQLSLSRLSCTCIQGLANRG